MVQTYSSVLYKELKIRGLFKFFSSKNSPIENYRVLENLLLELNVSKSSCKDIERDSPGAVLHLEYLMQKDESIKFGICDFFKVWMNQRGWQYGCRFDKGKGRRIQVSCYGNLKNCERRTEYNNYLEDDKHER